MGAISNFRQALIELHVDDVVVAQIIEGYEKITDRTKKENQAAFFAQAMARMDALLDVETCHAIRDSCACSKGGWRLKAVQKLAQEYRDRPLSEKIEALGHVTHMGKPVLNEDGTITAGIGDERGVRCPCPVFDRLDSHEPVSITYCYCCAGHFRFHYQIALGKKLVTQRVVSSGLASQGKEPCRFVYKIVD